MKSGKHGKTISAVEVSHISRHGFWLLISEHEHFVDFESHPWFKNAAVGKIMDVQLRHGHHLFWPALDVDLELESLENPKAYPLIDTL